MSYCSCVYVGENDNYPEFLNLREVVASKEYKCCECKQPIEIGERHIYEAGKWSESGFHQFRTCLACNELRDIFFCEGFAYGHVLQDLYEHVAEHQGDISEKCLSNLSPGARERMCHMIETFWGMQERIRGGLPYGN